MLSCRRYISLFVLILSVGVVRSQVVSTDFHFYFHPYSTVLDSTYMGNSEEIDAMVDYMHYLQSRMEKDSTIELQKVVVRGESSPEGSEQLNRRLARGRVDEAMELVRNTLNVPESKISRVNNYIDWDGLKEKVKLSNMAEKEEVLRVLNEDTVWVKYHLRGERIDARVEHLQELDSGRVWDKLLKDYFPLMCNAGVLFVTNKAVPQLIGGKAGTIAVDSFKMAVPVFEQDTTPVFVPVVVAPLPTQDTLSAEEWQRHVTLKTNAVGWALGLVNLGVEVDLAEHWSMQLPVYWSSWDYFKNTIKLRAVVLQPEVRYWFNETNEKWFVGAHFGLAWYNVAWNGKVRIQDQGWDKPGLGGGLAAGYRMPLSKKNPNWKVEFSLGVGVYAMRYDKFKNYKNGLLTDSGKKAFFCLDQAAISFSYSFDTKKKGGAK